MKYCYFIIGAAIGYMAVTGHAADLLPLGVIFLFTWLLSGDGL